MRKMGPEKSIFSLFGFVDSLFHLQFYIHRHYLDFINHFVKLHREKCSELEEQQLHLNVGLNKIAETVEQVEEMQKSLAVKSQVRTNFISVKIRY